jgi:N utilization substance protein A
VRSEAEVELEHTRSLEQLTAIAGISNMTAELLYQNGFKSLEDIAAADLDALLDVEGIGTEKATAILQAAREYLEAAKVEKTAASVEDSVSGPSEEEEPPDAVQEQA